MITVTQQTRNYVLEGDLELGQFDNENKMKILSVINHDNINHDTINHDTINHDNINHDDINHDDINHDDINMITLTIITLTMITLIVIPLSRFHCKALLGIFIVSSVSFSLSLCFSVPLSLYIQVSVSLYLSYSPLSLFPDNKFPALDSNLAIFTFI